MSQSRARNYVRFLSSLKSDRGRDTAGHFGVSAKDK